MTLRKSGYKGRLADQKIADMLRTFGAVSIEGPKWCGKTWTALNHANSVIYIGSPENNFQNRTAAELSPALVLEGEKPHLVDEWQEVPPIWDAVRFQVDQDIAKGQFILTGSATPNRKGILHSGTGRIGQYKMRTMTLFESGDSSGEISLQDVFNGSLASIRIEQPKLETLIHVTVRGGWPGALDVDPDLVINLPKSYLQNVVNEDAYKLDGIKRNTSKLMLLLRSLARNESTLVSNNKLIADIKEYENETIDSNTISAYLQVLDRLFLTDNQPSFSPNIRSAVRIGKNAKRHFIDPSLAIAAMEVTPRMLMNDLHTFGFLFESLCVRDLRIYAETFNAKIFHYRDHSGMEVDAIIELEDGRYGAFEIKLGANQIDDAATQLLRFKNFMQENAKGKFPVVLAVVCGLTSFAYMREDGVMVLPITALRP